MRSKREIKNCLEAWEKDPVLRKENYVGLGKPHRPAYFIIRLLEWILDDNPK